MDQRARRTDKCMRFLRRLKTKGKAYQNFTASIEVLEEEAKSVGLSSETMKLLISVLTSTELNSRPGVALINCMLPRNKVSDSEIDSLISWFLTLSAPAQVLSSLLQWFIGCWEYQLASWNRFYVFYDCFFYIMLKDERLETRLAQLMYRMTKREDVSRRQVDRLLRFSGHFTRPRKHITALLSLFKSYKPEVVPEKIQAINIQSVWKPISEPLREGFKKSRALLISGQTAEESDELTGWILKTIPKMNKNQEPLVPSVEYFDIGSSLFKNVTEKSIFDIKTMSSLAKYHSNVKLPSSSTSLLSNTIGHHLLTYADPEYQRRFACNLYYTLFKAFIFENGRYTKEEMCQILEMIADSSRYMQNTTPIVSRFINDYLSYGIDSSDYNFQLHSIMQWGTASPELDDHIEHLKSSFYFSSLGTKRLIIQTLRKLLENLCILSDESLENKRLFFLNQSFDKFEVDDYIIKIEKVVRELVTAGLNIHDYDTTLLSEALEFYEQYNMLLINKETSFIPLAPESVVYGCFVNRSCAILSRACALLLQYRKYFKNHTGPCFNERIGQLITYAEDFSSGLWHDNCFSNRFHKNRKFLRNIPKELVSDYSSCDMNSSLNVLHHYAFLPYMHVLNSSGLEVKTKKDANAVASHYYIHVYQLILTLISRSSQDDNN